MLKGRFGDTSGRPFIEAKVHLRRLKVQASVSFLIDTGADSTSILPADLTLMGIDSTHLGRASECVGIGGVMPCYAEDALLVFADESFLYTYELPINLILPAPGLEDMPSLLGRDIIHRWTMNYDYPKNTIGIEVRSATHKIRL